MNPKETTSRNTGATSRRKTLLTDQWGTEGPRNPAEETPHNVPRDHLKDDKDRPKAT
ncbi:Hypothetical protein SMAX5B_022079 [Scophthalmus maximus]|uniref:Uncharacterized protein n=1 Tax=Scophthalmus maximus TaxID=52904 RepID=A0A2U9BUH2_SCOMX|nr:Hypothetical protein SMAX5B_022079 [Scophthalmus maximus]